MDRLGELKRRVITTPDDVEARFELAQALAGYADTGGALRQLDRATELDPYHQPSRRLRVDLLRQDGRSDEALRELGEMVHRAPDDLALRDELARALHEDERIDDALFHLEEAVRRGGATVPRLVHIAELASVKQLPERARVALVEAHRLEPEHPSVNLALRNLYVELGDEVLAEQVAGAPRTRDYFLRQTRTSLHEQRLSSAVASGPPALASAFASLWSGDLATAERALDGWDAGGGEPSLLAEFLRGELLLIEGDRVRATAAFRRVLDHDGAFGLAWNRLGDLRQADGALRDAASHYKKAILFSPDDANAYEDLGDIHASLGETEAAARMYDKATARDPRSHAARKKAALDRPPPPAPTVAEARIGVLGWNPKGGGVSPLEAVAVPGRGELIFTGNIGPVCQESARVAISCLKARAVELGLGDLLGRDLHLHFTDTHLGKDGSSLGLALALAAASAYTGRPLRPHLAASGGITVLGEVVKVGGVREKVLAAHLAGIDVVLLPRRNLRETQSIDEELRPHVEILLVDNVSEAVALGLVTDNT